MAFWRGKKKYTGFDFVAKRRRAGTQKLVDWVRFLNAGKITNLGTFTVRDMRGKPGKTSVHATGRAIDFGYKHREDGLALIDFLVRNWEAFGIEMVADYFPEPWGRAWRCDRGGWKVYTSKTIGGAPGGKWIHVEVSNEVADDAAYIDWVFSILLAPTEGHKPSSSSPSP